ncbi:MAG: hypothetical protein IKY98_00870 [Alphaproteobacteria bacterium]|nr:hypothetical protein [Alphaproteobacteria bacterium]
MKQTIFSKYNQSGRSMVEILGAIAIIGVLSIGGIIGYSYGMDKYRANQAIHQITLRGMDVVTHASTMEKGNTEWLDKIWENEDTIYPTSFFYEEEFDRFGMQMTGVPSAVCRLIGNGLPSNIETRIEVDGEEHEIEDHIEECDLSDENTMYFFFGDRNCVPACHSNQVCDDGKCIGLQCKNNVDCNKGYDGNCSRCTLGHCDVAFGSEGTDCTFEDGTKGFCTQGTCVPKADNGCTYTTNVCDPGFYCASTNTSNTEAFPAGETGTCIEPRFDKHTITVNGVSETWYISENTLSYWDAVAACTANHSAMASVGDFMTNWTGGNDASRNNRAKALNTGDYIDFWTNTPYDDASTQMFSVNLSTDYGNVLETEKKNSEYNYVLCKGIYNNTCNENACNTDCPCRPGWYCPSSNATDKIAFQATSVCRQPQLNEVEITVNGIPETWYISPEPLNWWDAQSVCAAKGSALPQASDLVNDWSGSNNWSGTYTARGTELEKQKKSAWISAHTETSGYFVDFSNDWNTFIIDRWSRSSKKFYALCKKP